MIFDGVALIMRKDGHIVAEPWTTDFTCEGRYRLIYARIPNAGLLPGEVGGCCLEKYADLNFF